VCVCIYFGSGMSAKYGMEFAWPYDGHDVHVVGSWSNWRDRVHLGPERRVVLQLPRGFYMYKFVVDGRWCYDMLRPHTTDDCGNINNVVSVPRGEFTIQTLPLVPTFVEGDAAWDCQKEACVRALAKRRPAIVCSQRGQHDQLAYVCQRAGPYRRTGLPVNGSDGSFNAVMWDSVQLLHVASGDFWLSDKPNMPGSRFDEAPEPCMATWALLRPYFPGDPAVIVCSTALDCIGSTEELRVKQGEVLIDQLSKLISAITSGEICDQGTQKPVSVAAVVLAGRFGEPMLSQDGKTRRKLYDTFAKKGFCDCFDIAREKALNYQLGVPNQEEAASLMHNAAEDWILVLKRRPDTSAPVKLSAPTLAFCTDSTLAQLPTSWTPTSRTDIAEFSIAAEKGEALTSPGCERSHMPLSATFVATELPYTVPMNTKPLK